MCEWEKRSFSHELSGEWCFITRVRSTSTFKSTWYKTRKNSLFPSKFTFYFMMCQARYAHNKITKIRRPLCANFNGKNAVSPPPPPVPNHTLYDSLCVNEVFHDYGRLRHLGCNIRLHKAVTLFMVGLYCKIIPENHTLANTFRNMPSHRRRPCARAV